MSISDRESKSGKRKMTSMNPAGSSTATKPHTDTVTEINSGTHENLQSLGTQTRESYFSTISITLFNAQLKI